jgi:predicted Zn-dependent protease
MPTRVEMLQQLLTEHPEEALPRYSLAIEYANAGNVEGAMQHFLALLERHPDYSAGHFMAAQTLAKAGRTAEARHYLEQGIAAAVRTGNRHAQTEMQGMLYELSH